MVDAVVNLVHLLATAIWLGGAIFIKLILEPASRQIDPRENGKLQGLIARRFTIAAWTSLVLLLITGIMKTPSEMYLDFSSDMGRALAIKHILVAAVFAVGLIIALVAVPRMRHAAPGPGAAPSDAFLRAQRFLLRLSLTSTLLGIGVLICASFLW